ncbi:MAG: polymer-forming cytoskeletal protein [bacterium]|nr:polymer-forming cytoskeletal protein [bacterium]
MADQSSRRFTDQSGTTSTVIGKGIHVKGEITGSAPIEVWGSIEGKAGTEGLFWVREGGKVGGEIAATNIVVEGQVDGTISAKDKAELRSSCKVEGNVTAKTVAIAEGSFFEGRVHMGGSKSSKQVNFQEKRKP